MSTAANCFYAALLLLSLHAQFNGALAANSAPQFVHFHDFLDLQPYPDESPFEPTLAFHQIGNTPFLTVADARGCGVHRIDDYYNYPREPEKWRLHEEIFYGSPSDVVMSACMFHRPPDQESDFLWIQYAECDSGRVDCESPIYERTGDETYTEPSQHFVIPGVRECQGVPNENEVFCACFKNQSGQDTQSPVYRWDERTYERTGLEEILESVTGVDAYHFKMRGTKNAMLSSEASISPIYIPCGGWTATLLSVPLATLTISACELSTMLYPACGWATADTGKAELWCHNEHELEMNFAGNLEIGNTRRVRCLDRRVVSPSYAIQALDHPSISYSILHSCNSVSDNTRIACEPYDVGFPRAREVDVFVHTSIYWPQIIAFLEDRGEQGYVFSFYADSDITASPPPSEPPSSSEDSEGPKNGENIAILFAVIVVPIAGIFCGGCLLYLCLFKRPDGQKFEGDNCFQVNLQAAKEAIEHLFEPLQAKLLSVISLPQFRWLCLVLALGNLLANICFFIVLSLGSVFACVVIMLCLYICLTAERQDIRLMRFDRVIILLGLVLSYIFFGLALMAIYEDSDKENDDLAFGIASFIAISPLYFKLVKSPAEKLWRGNDDTYSTIQ